MEIHQLRYFVALAEEGSFSRAAERCVRPTSRSQQIQKLEGDINQQLFDRLARGRTPTAAGASLLPLARKILNDVGDARRCVEERVGAIAGIVRAGMIPTIAPYYRAFAIRLSAEVSAAEVQVVEDVTKFVSPAGRRRV